MFSNFSWLAFLLGILASQFLMPVVMGLFSRVKSPTKVA